MVLRFCAHFFLYTQVIESEYAAKYLELLGANPTPAAQDLVHKALPLTVDCLQTKLKVSTSKHLTPRRRCLPI